MAATVDITPSPRILRTLGEIPFEPWQCLAELIDNSVDAFAEATRAGVALPDKRITVAWSTEAVGTPDRTIEILDNGPGMILSQLQNAARAGYSSNDPVNNLGLFGMGFNISTARLGENTRLLSATKNCSAWTGIEIDFAKLIGSKSYDAKVIVEPKKSPNEHGTKVVVSRLKGETYARLRDHETQVRGQLENIYSTMLGGIDVDIYLQGKKLSPRHHCVWGGTRYVQREAKHIPAVIEIDRDLGNALFDLERNAYLSWDEKERVMAENPEGVYPPNIIERQKRLRGWVGIQRYADPNDFGIDFIRNGRKVLISNKELFYWANPMTLTSKLEYPVELGTTVGGRIVGEVHVDYLLPTYQKNDFDRTDPSWRQTVEALRGVGPILPRDRTAMGYSDPNSSPVGLLANAYRRMDPGTKCLYIDKSTARILLERFKNRDTDFLTDDKWWKAAQEADRQAATRGADAAAEVDAGTTSSDDPGDYGPTATTPALSPLPLSTPSVVGGTSGPVAAINPAVTSQATSTLGSLMLKSSQVISWTGPYAYGSTPPMQVKVWELKSDHILRFGVEVPFAFFQDGIECDFIFNPRHPLLSQYPIEPRQMLCLYLAELFKARDRARDVGELYASLVQNRLQDLRVDKVSLQEKAGAMFDRLRHRFLSQLESRKVDVLACIHESSGEVEETVMNLLFDSRLVLTFQNKEPDGFAALEYVPFRTLLRLVDRFPRELFDGKVFVAPYATLSLDDTQANERARSESKDRVMSFLKDALWVLGQAGAISASRGKDELSRCAHSINFLSREIVD